MNVHISESKLAEELKKRYKKAKRIIQNAEEAERFLQKLEKKLKKVPFAGDTLADIPVMISLVKSYTSKEYTDIPVSCIISVVSALIYFLSPIDIISDYIPFVGYIDDAAVIKFCTQLAQNDIKKYKQWRFDNGKAI